VRKLVYESDFSEEDANRMSNSEAASDRRESVDEGLARRDYAMKLLSKVSEQERTLMLLKEVEGHSVEELASMTGMNENTIKVKLFRARQKLLKAAKRLSRATGVSID
jgi:RNA polymerase sigma-70 factor (ECF subfamily)